MKQTVVFFDLDGTLMSDDKTILPSTRQAVDALRQKGILTVVCTGRAPRMFQTLCEELGFDSYISMNGQHVVFEGTELYSNPMDREVLKECSELAKERGHGITYSNFETFAVNTAEHPHVTASMGRLKLEYPPVDAEIYSHSPVHQMQLYCEEAEAAEYMERFPEYTFIRWDECSIDMLPNGASKAVGIQKFLDHLNLPIENSYAFGDGANDIEMISTVGTGIAMGNAIPELKEVADVVTTSCTEDGILNGLLQVGLLTEQDLAATVKVQ